MKRQIFILTTLALLVGAPSLVRAEDTGPNSSTNATVKPYPLKYCIVSGDKFEGDMDQPVTNNYHGQQIIFCCKDCVKDFKKDPDKYLKKIKDAVAKGKIEKK